MDEWLTRPTMNDRNEKNSVTAVFLQLVRKGIGMLSENGCEPPLRSPTVY